jgi:hypothetical protein
MTGVRPEPLGNELLDRGIQQLSRSYPKAFPLCDYEHDPAGRVND